MLKLKQIKKGVSTVTMMATVFCLSGVSMLAPLTASAAVIADGALISVNTTNSDGTPTVESLDVYIVKTVGTKKFKRLILNPQVFSSYQHLDWRKVTKVSPAVMNEYITSNLARVDGDSKVYALTPAGDTGAKSWIELTATQFVDEANSDADSIYTINGVDAGNYRLGSPITTVAQLKSFYKDGSLPAPVVEGSDSVTLSSNTAKSVTLPKGSVQVPYTTIRVSAGSTDITVTGMTVKRTGLGSASDFDKVFVAKDGVIRGTERSLNTSDEAFLLFSTGSNPIVVKANTSEDITVYANMRSTANTGNVNALSVTALQTNVSNLSGLPVTGNAMTIASVEAPGAAVNLQSVGGSVKIGDNNVEVAKVKVTNTNSNEDITVRAIAFKSVSPASGTKIDNNEIGKFVLYEGSTALTGEVELDSNGYAVMTLNNPLVVEKGGSKNKTLTLKANIVGGSGKTIVMDVANKADANITGNTNNFRTINTITGTATSVNVAETDLSITTATGNPKTQTVLGNQTLTLLKAKITAGKGDVTVDKMTVTLDSNVNFDAVGNKFENLKVYINGTLVSTEATINKNGTTQNFAFTDTFAITGSADVEVTVDAKNVAKNNWITATIPSGDKLSATRDSDGKRFNATGSAKGNKQTIGEASVNVTRSTTPSSSEAVKGAKNVEFLGVNVTAGTTDDVTITDMKFELVAKDGGTSHYNDVNEVTLYTKAGAKVAGPVGLNTSKQAVFSGLNLALKKGTSAQYVVKANLNSTINDSSVTKLYFTVPVDGVTVRNSQGDDITAPNAAVNNGADTKIILVDRGNLTVVSESQTPKTHQVLSNSTGDVAWKLKITANKEDITINKLTLTDNKGKASTVVSKVTLKADNTEIAHETAITDNKVVLSIDGGYTIKKGQFAVLSVINDYHAASEFEANGTNNKVQWQIADLGTDLEATGVAEDVYAVLSTGGTDLTINHGDGYNATDTTMTINSNTVFQNKYYKVATTNEIVKVTSNSGTQTSITVARGQLGTTAAAIGNGSTLTALEKVVSANTAVVHGNFPTITTMTQPTGTLAAGTFEVLKFKVSGQKGAENALRLGNITVAFTGVGVGSTIAANGLKAYIGGTEIGSSANNSVLDTNGNQDIIMSAATVADREITDGTLEVVIKATMGTVNTNQAVQFSIAGFGTVDAAGSVISGAVTWNDEDDYSTDVKWIQNAPSSILGSVLKN